MSFIKMSEHSTICKHYFYLQFITYYLISQTPSRKPQSLYGQKLLSIKGGGGGGDTYGTLFDIPCIRVKNYDAKWPPIRFD